MLVTTQTNVTYPVAMKKVKGAKYRAFLDTWSGRLYISETFIDQLKINPFKIEYKAIETLKQIPALKSKSWEFNENFSFQTVLNKSERGSHYITKS